MIIDLHKQHSRHIFIRPCVITKSFSQAMAANRTGNMKEFDSMVNDPPCLDTAYRLSILPVRSENEGAVPPSVAEEKLKGFHRFRMEGDCLHFLRFPLPNREPLLEFPAAFIINVSPTEPEEIGNPEGGMRAQDNHGMVSVLAAEQEVSCKITKVGFVADRFSSGHGGIPL